MDIPCSASSEAAGEPLIGSAPEAVGWVCLEQNGPWGAKAWTSSHLDPVVGAEIEAAAAAHRLRASLIRRPGRHADISHDSPRTVFVAHSRPGGSWLLAGPVESPEKLLALDWSAVAAGSLEETAASLPGLSPAPPQLLVCTNGARDTCCARLGRPVAAAAVLTSGHRLAPTTVLLPSGSLHGRVLDAAPLLSAESAGELVLTGYRGRSVWATAGQVADEHVRREFGVTGLDDLTVAAAGEDWLVSHRDGRSWTVRVTTYEEGERPESCGKEAKPILRHRVSVAAD